MSWCGAGRKNHRTCRVGSSCQGCVAMFGWHVMPRWSKNIMVIVLNAREYCYLSKWENHFLYSPALNEKVPVSSPVGGCLTIETDWKRNTASASMSHSPKNPNVLFPGLHMTSFSGTSQLALLYRHFWDNPAINFGATWRSVKPPGRRGNEAKVLLAHGTAVDAFDIFILALRRSQQMDRGAISEFTLTQRMSCFESEKKLFCWKDKTPSTTWKLGKYSSLDRSWVYVYLLRIMIKSRYMAYHSHFYSQAQISTTTSSDCYNDTWLKTERKHPKSGYAGLVVPSLKLKSSPLKIEAPRVQEIPQPTGTSSQLPSWGLAKKGDVFLAPNKKPSPWRGRFFSCLLDPMNQQFFKYNKQTAHKLVCW